MWTLPLTTTLRGSLTVTVKQLAAAGGIANASFDNNDIVIPQTNEQARTSLNGSDRDGKTGLAIPANGDGVQGYTLSIIYKHH